MAIQSLQISFTDSPSSQQRRIGRCERSPRCLNRAPWKGIPKRSNAYRRSYSQWPSQGKQGSVMALSNKKIKIKALTHDDLFWERALLVRFTFRTSCSHQSYLDGIQLDCTACPVMENVTDINSYDRRSRKRAMYLRVHWRFAPSEVFSILM